LEEILFLAAAGILGGIVNSLAGGGSFITFPALIAVGVPPVIANASNTFAATAGYLSGTYALRQEIKDSPKKLLILSFISAIGGIIGAYLLTQTSNSEFEKAVPWLLLFATVLFIYGGHFNKTLQKWGQQHRHIDKAQNGLFTLLFIGVSIYGGFFNAGLGILMLSYCSLAGYRSVNEMNALKLLYSSTISGCAIVLFLINDLISWHETLVLLVGTLIGGYAAGIVSKRIPNSWVRRAIIFASTGITLWFFMSTYLLS
jgi:uncharacterized protein